MARLLIKTEGLGNRTLELRLGVNRVGRSPDADFTIGHPTVSSNHCELVVSQDGVLLRDCHSTNGTFVNGDAVVEIWLQPGQELKFGDVELLVENTEVNVAIPQFERERPKPPVARKSDGALMCPRHSQEAATYQCTYCREVMCSHCIHVLKRKGGQPLFLCPLCSHKCEPLQTGKSKKKRGFIGFLQDTVKLRFKHTITRENSEK